MASEDARKNELLGVPLTPEQKKELIDAYYNPVPPVRTCRVCACTDARGCPRGCVWKLTDLCSVCALAIIRQAELYEGFLQCSAAASLDVPALLLDEALDRLRAEAFALLVEFSGDDDGPLIEVVSQ